MNGKKALSIQKALIASAAWENETIGRIGVTVNPMGKTEIHITDIMDMDQDGGYITERTYPNSGLLHRNKIDITLSIYSRYAPPNSLETDINE